MHDTDYLLIALPLKTIDLKNVWTEPEYINIPPPPSSNKSAIFGTAYIFGFVMSYYIVNFPKKLMNLSYILHLHIDAEPG